ncbi:DedA family protein [Cupriavidus plantarum]|uniref:DedA family protein n=1 Tax=Cupriavidus plantarum TaxID=942865 RepID=UPI000E27BDB4|nr:DedA family protein [Cupriavidus plantarum]NYH99122.1 membrane-associated protein [Cupriavidus plantarum]REF02901.1 membrane-associated protein [Cupriavidus plantarum]RLK44234.1 membrane-associated protein [Cupriavidus plantarum]CAG2142082.1 Protein DedA [Cupriavidus plantarum]SMR65436.1 membrane-associated protein [Cupriavidus plantarum]
MDTVLQLLDMVLHVDKFLGQFVQDYGVWVYGILFAIVFAETGLVVLPFLPGDSLLFIAGAMCATGAMNEWVLSGLLLVAAISGNTVNYMVGSWIGPKVFEHEWRFLDQKALRRTHDFYERHGGKTLVMARFIPIVRTFAPFVAGVSQMTFARFQLFNVLGALLWVVGLVFAGYFFGNLPFIKQYLNLIVLAGIGAAVVPLVLGGLWRLVRGNKRRASADR